MERVTNRHMIMSAEEHRYLPSVQKLFRKRVKSSSVLDTSDYILVTCDNLLINLFTLHA